MPFYNRRLQVVRFLTINGEKRVILQTPDSKTISLPLSWTDFLNISGKNESDSLWANCEHLLALYDLINLIKERSHEQKGDNIGKEEKSLQEKRYANDIVRNSRKKDLVNFDPGTTMGDRRDICSDSSRYDQGGEGV